MTPQVLLVGLLYIVTVSALQYSSQWAVHIEGGQQAADDIAARHGFTILGQIFPDLWHFEHQKIAKRSIDPSPDHHTNLVMEPKVKWAKQQIIKSRRKRDYLPLNSEETSFYLNDPRWMQMWYLHRGNGLDMSVLGAWKEGVTGKGVVVTILDDGLEKDHPDLMKNYDPQASYDVNNRDDDPMPRYDLIDSNRHGTRCAGEVAATANNSLCAVGVAYGASVGGVRMLDGDVTDAVEARSLSLNPQHIDIYSASWGPDDDGKTVDGPGELAMRAFIEGVTKGRSGKGSIFVWASGNGGRDSDNCNCDGYTNSIWTLSISSATENGLVPWYSEACSSTLATTYSSGSSGERQVVTTDLHHQCTSSHTGTSASAPLAAGICALALEANRALTWRDMQHIVVATARPANLRAPDWTVNGVGRNVSHSFGYGLMDATSMVRVARTWQTVPEQHKCEVSAPHINKGIPPKGTLSLKLNVKECTGVNYLEHVQAKITLMSQRRGDLQIQLTSPAGTKSTLLARRPHDISRAGFDSWPFMSVHTWGEQPFGVWQLDIHNEGRYLGRATLHEWALLFYGTETPPNYLPPFAPPYPVNLPPPPRKNKNRKNKSGSTTSKPWKSSTKENRPFKKQPVTSSPPRKTARPSVISARRPTTAPATKPPLQATSSTGPTAPVSLILLAPALQPSNLSPPLFPAIFQKYHKVQQLYPYSRLYESPPRPAKKGVSQGDPMEAKSPGQLIDWQVIFYGTDTPPQTSALTPSPPVRPTTSKPSNSWTDVKTLDRSKINSDFRDHMSDISGCKKTTETCLVCDIGWRLAEGFCHRQCPEGFYPELPEANIARKSPQTQAFCARCHYSCRSCSGPNDYQCTLCFGDALLVSSDQETYCYPRSLATAVDISKWYYWTCVGLGLNILLLLGFSCYLYCNGRGCSVRKPQMSVTFTKKASSAEAAVLYDLARAESDSD
ncbi:furin-like protease 1, isoforms 1/1-X/2 isoform X1 [Macrosteles quadrilineatus]|uniref:furin-like protease 1, isoforms 1/1-X/2 isoform X1 n=1 Tax=Macrosteles quadrilineatus TaxID=74068 RepID=UPI0023E1C9B5|nr:furin-like protease 1, isoforms 1/1-X/2 isoform X1 [Macrosteles quadrilineatus]